MASKVFTSTAASTLVSNWALKGPLLIGLGPHSGLSVTPSPIKTPSSKSSLVVRAQQTGGPRRIEPMVTYIERTPCNTSENDHEIRMWFDTPGLAPENIEVGVIDDLLIIKGNGDVDPFGNGDVDPFGNKIFEPYNNRVQLPINTFKEEITAAFKNGVLYITVPKITKSDPKLNIFQLDPFNRTISLNIV